MQAPALQRLEWVKSAIELVLLLLAIPWIIKRLYRSPKDGLKALGDTYFAGALG